MRTYKRLILTMYKISIIYLLRTLKWRVPCFEFERKN